MIYNKEAEESVINSLFTYGKECFVRSSLLKKLKPEHFFDRYNQLIFTNILEIYNKGLDIDLITFKNHVENKKLDQNIIYIAYDIVGRSISHVSLLDQHALIILDKYTVRSILNSIKNIVSENIEDSETIIDTLESKILPIINEIKELSGYNIYDITNALKVLVRTIDEQDENKYIKTYFEELDKLIVRFRKSNYIILAARPSIGKTAFALSIIDNILKVSNEKKIVFFSLEMSVNEIMARFISMQTGLPVFNILDNRLNVYDWENINHTIGNLEKLNLFIIDDSTLTVGDIESIIHRLNKDKDIGLVIIDYIQLINHKELKKQREEKITEISRNIKRIAKSEEIPILCLAQLNRDIEKRANKRPMLSDLRESGSLEQDADIVMFMHRPNFYEEMSDMEYAVEGITEIHVAKNRNGQTGIAKAIFNKEHIKFEDFKEEIF